MTNELGDLASDYIVRGNSGINIRQCDFLHLVPQPEFAVTSTPTRTLGDVISTDFFSTADRLRKIYVPRYDLDGWESARFFVGLRWARKHRKEMATAGMGGKDWEALPYEVGINFHTISFMGAFWNDRRPGWYTAEVAYQPGIPDWEADLRRTTFSEYYKIRSHPYEWGKWQQAQSFSTTRTLKILTEFFWSGGLDNREEAADMLTWELLKTYWLALGRRVRV